MNPLLKLLSRQAREVLKDEQLQNLLSEDYMEIYSYLPKSDLKKLMCVREILAEYNTERSSFTDVGLLAKHLINKIGSKQQEHLMVIAVDSKLQIINSKVIFIGTNNSSLVTPREIIKFLVLHNATGCFIGHNHPSGVLSPSSEDLRATNRLIEATNIVGIKLYDHIIVSGTDFYSLREQTAIFD